AIPRFVPSAVAPALIMAPRELKHCGSIAPAVITVATIATAAMMMLPMPPHPSSPLLCAGGGGGSGRVGVVSPMICPGAYGLKVS
ncbi:MAG: hypothetical protein U1A72_03065, partial [Sulfuritalea sp.]|nr:hypothetical protein [Sulfuritalea sp.]